MMCSQIDKCCFANPLSSSTIVLPTFLSAASSQSACREAFDELSDCNNHHPEIGHKAKEALDVLTTCLQEERGLTTRSKECIKTFTDLFVPYCPSVVESIKTSCDITSFKFEDFALDLAEELEDRESK
jgi:hypothetical protein